MLPGNHGTHLENPRGLKEPHNTLCNNDNPSIKLALSSTLTSPLGLLIAFRLMAVASLISSPFIQLTDIPTGPGGITGALPLKTAMLSIGVAWAPWSFAACRLTANEPQRGRIGTSTHPCREAS